MHFSLFSINFLAMFYHPDSNLTLVFDVNNDSHLFGLKNFTKFSQKFLVIFTLTKGHNFLFNTSQRSIFACRKDLLVIEETKS